MIPNHKSGCLICGQELLYFETIRPLACALCGNHYDADASCTDGHYVCNTCHSGSANDWIEGFCAHSPETDPIALAVTLMKSSKVKMHGPEHHFLVPAVLLTACYNLEGKPAEKALKLAQARKRAENVLGGFCGFYGACGAGIGTGIFTSVMTGANPLSEKPWRLSNLITAESLKVIAEHGGPRCCKRDTFLALQTAGSFVQQHFDITLPLTDPVHWEFSAFNKECLECDCPFYMG